MANYEKFILRRHVDVSGISGTGDVAEGVQFSDGTCVLRWKGKKASTAIYQNIEDLKHIHEHAGSSEILWLI